MRIAPAHAGQLARIRSGTANPALKTAPGAHHWHLRYLEFAANLDGFGDIIQIGDGSGSQNTVSRVPHDLFLSHLYVHGDRVVGQKRCIALNAASVTIRDSYIADCKGVGNDTQAIGGWNGPGPYHIDQQLPGSGRREHPLRWSRSGDSQPGAGRHPRSEQPLFPSDDVAAADDRDASGPDRGGGRRRQPAGRSLRLSHRRPPIGRTGVDRPIDGFGRGDGERGRRRRCPARLAGSARRLRISGLRPHRRVGVHLLDGARHVVRRCRSRRRIGRRAVRRRNGLVRQEHLRAQERPQRRHRAQHLREPLEGVAARLRHRPDTAQLGRQVHVVRRRAGALREQRRPSRVGRHQPARLRRRRDALTADQRRGHPQQPVLRREHAPTAATPGSC